MSLAAPTNVQIGAVSRVPLINGVPQVYLVNPMTGQMSYQLNGSEIQGPFGDSPANGLRFTARVTWTNNELSNHWLVVTVKRVSPSAFAATVSETLVPRAAQGFDVVLDDWMATDSLEDRSYQIEVKLVSPLGDESQSAAANYNLSLSDSYTVGGEIFYEDASEAIDGISGFNLPSRTEKVRLGGGASMARISYAPLGTTGSIKPFYSSGTTVGMWKEPQRIPQVIADYGEEKISGLKPRGLTPIQTGDLGLIDGGFYVATVTYVRPKAPTVVQVNGVNRFTDYHEQFTKQVVFEYWDNGYPKPVITTVLNQNVQAGVLFSTKLAATGANTLSVDFGTTEGLTYDAATGFISGVFTTGGQKQITLNATNSYGVTSAILRVNVEVPVAAITSGLERTVAAGIPFSYVVAATGAKTIEVDFGGESLAYNALTRTITGTFTSVGVKTIAITASNDFNSVTSNLLVTVNVVAPSFTSALTVSAKVGAPFTYTVAANNAATYGVAFGTVTGLTFNEQTKVISGTFTVAGTYNVSLSADNDFANQTANLVITAVEEVIAPIETKPLLISTTSVLEFEQYEYWQYQPVALGTNVVWSIDPIAPPGMEFDGTFGTLFGAVARQGVYQVVLRANNEGGSSDPLILTIGIRNAPQRRRTWAVDVDIDVVTRKAVIAGSAQAGGGTGSAAYQQAIKFRDNLLYHVRFFKNSTRLDLGITKLGWSLKRAAEGNVLASGETWRKIGFGGDATYALHVDLNDSRLAVELQDVEVGDNDAQASFVGLGEFEWLQTNEDYDAVGPETVRGSSQGMPVLVVADQNQIHSEEI